MMIYLKNMAGFKMDFFKGMTYTDIRPIFEKHYNLNQAFLERVEEDVIGQKEEEGTNDDDDDVYTEATPLAFKVPIVDYQIHYENNKPYYKIIRADGIHQLFLSFITLLKKFDREDLEMLWKLVQERFQSSEPKNFSDDFLLNTLKTIFEKPNIILLVEKKYHLTRFSLEQMLNNVRLEIEEESEMSLELLRIQHYLQNEHYALWEVIEFGDSYKAHLEETGKGPASESSAKKKGRTIVITTENMQKRRNDVKARTTLLLALPDEHQDDLDIMSLDDVYNHLKVYEPEVQKKLESNYQNMAFISSSNTSSGKGEVHTASVPTASIQVSTASTNVAAASLSHDTSTWKSRQRKKESYKQGPKEEKLAPKALMAIDGIRWDWSYMANEEENRALIADDEVPIEFALIAKSSSSSENKVEDRLVEFKEHEIKFCEKIRGIDRDVEVEARLVEFKEHEIKFCEKIRGLERDVEEVKDQIRIMRVLDIMLFPPPAQLYSPPKKDLSWTGSIMSEPMIKFVKVADYPRVIKANNTKNARKSTVKYAEMYRNTSKSPKVWGNQRNWNNLKSQQLGKDFLMQNKACFKCGYFNHLASDCDVWVEKGKTWPKNNFAHKRMTPKVGLLKPGTTPIAVSRPNMNVAQPKMTSFAKTTHSNVKRPFQGKSAVRTQPRVLRVSTVTKMIPTVDLKFPTAKSTFTADLGNKGKAGNPQNNINDKGYWDSGCSRHMTGNISYLSKPDSMFAVCAYARHQVIPKECHLYAVIRIFRYLKGHPKLGLWYPKESPFNLVAYSNSDYGGATQDRKSTTREHNIDFHQIVDFLEAYHIRYALTISPTVYVSHIRQFWSTARIETTNQETKILVTVDGKSQTISESSLRRHHKLNDKEGISSLPDEQHLPQHDSLPHSHPTPTTKQIPQAPTEPLTHRQYTRRAKWIAQSKALSPTVDEPASLLRDDRQGEAFPTVSSLDVGQERENIAKTSTLPHESSARVTSLDANEGNQDLEISRLKARVKSLKDMNKKSAKPTQEDAPIKREIIEIGEELGADKSTELGSNDTNEIVKVLSLMEATNILTSGGAAASVSPAEVLPAAGVPTVSGSFPTVRAIFTTTRKQKVVESEVPKKRKLQEQIDAQVAKEMEEEFARESQRLSEQLVRDSKIARLHAEEELKMMIKEKLELINELVKYQDHSAKILKYQAQQSKPLSKKEQSEFIILQTVLDEELIEASSP
nr:hypothetical protein [Tanacetum cinerariifolium]